MKFHQIALFYLCSLFSFSSPFSMTRPLVRPTIALLFCLGIVVMSISSLAPPEHDATPEFTEPVEEQPPVEEQKPWIWRGGAQLDPAMFAAMAQEVLEVMPVLPSREDLVLLLSETVATESSFGYAVRDRSGKTLGVYQILQTTAEFVLRRLEEFPELRSVVMAYMEPSLTLRENLMHNLHFQTALAITYYWMRAGDELREHLLSLKERAKLYKLKWNTPKGKATEAKYIRDSRRFLVSGW